MIIRFTSFAFATVLFVSLASVSGVSAQELVPANPDSLTGIFDKAKESASPSLSPSPSELKAARAAELRQSRALYRSQQRIARLEHNLWTGHEPLRPNWNSVPMMSSRYDYRRTIYVPVYIRAR
ncbi:MAG: hypothetical protein WBD20_14010 [Pirellulaceae bacterium]